MVRRFGRPTVFIFNLDKIKYDEIYTQKELSILLKVSTTAICSIAKKYGFERGKKVCKPRMQIGYKGNDIIKKIKERPSNKFYLEALGII